MLLLKLKAKRFALPAALDTARAVGKAQGVDNIKIK